MVNPIRVVVTDDHPIVRKGIKHFLDQAIDIQVVGEASTAEETLQLVDEVIPDILVLDMQLPDMNGLEVTRHLQQSGSPVKILVLSAHDDPRYIQELIEAGVMGYLIKEEAPQVIVEAVRGVAHGEQGWFSRSVAARMMSWMRGDLEQEIKFTRREMEILRLVTDGKTNQNIAALLGISEKTVEKYLYSIFQKIGVSSRTEVAVYAVREGIV